MYNCPVYGKKAFPWFKKLFIGPFGYSKCSNCNSKISISLDKVTYLLLLIPLGYIAVVAFTNIEFYYIGIISFVIVTIVFSILWLRFTKLKVAKEKDG